MKKICYIPINGVDNTIAEVFGWYTENDKGQKIPDVFRSANLRSMYDSSKPSPLNIEDLKGTIAALKGYSRDLAIINSRKVNYAQSNLSKSYDRLRREFTLEQRNDRVVMIANYYSSVLDKYQEKYPNIPRSAIARGFYDKNGNLVGGPAAIFDEVYGILCHNRAKYYRGSQMDTLDSKTKKECERKFHALDKVVIPDNYAALVSRARFILRDTEGLILGQKLEYTATVGLENYKEGELDEIWDASESKREGWMEKTDETSAFGSIGIQVRKFLSTIPRINEGIETDDLGCTRFIDPITAHSKLVELLTNVIDENHMMSLLTDSKGNARQAWLIPVVERLKKDPLLRTQFFVDFNKNFQPYSIFFEDKEESRKAGATRWKTKVINKVRNLLGTSYKLTIFKGAALSDNSIFNDVKTSNPGTVNWANLAKLRDSVEEWTKETPSTNIFKRSDAKLLQRGKDAPSKSEKIRFLSETFAAMGIAANADTIEQIVTTNAIYKIHRALSNYFDINGATGITLVLKGDDATAWNKGEYSDMSKMLMTELYTTKQKSTDKKGKLYEHTEKILEVVTKLQEGTRVESRARFGDKTLFSHVTPSYLGDKLKVIKSYAEANDKKGLKQYLLSEYCDNSLFVEKDNQGNITHIYSFWLRTLLDCCDTPDNIRLEDTFAGNFDFERDLGNTDQSFEDFTSKTHAIDMLTHYYADKETTKTFKAKSTKDKVPYERQYSALFPVFILGDSGVSKYLRAPRINIDKNGVWGEDSKAAIVDHLYEVYKQELKRIELVSKMNTKLSADGYAGVKASTEFSILTFLNDPEYKLPQNPKENEIKAAITQYMNNATKEFIKKLDLMGVTEIQLDANKKSTGRLQHLNQFAKPETLYSVIEDFYWNTKFATIQQLQLMTIDPSFYDGTKDLQKRYKEIHAPGSKLSLYARNPFKEGNPYYNCDNNGNPLPETVVYFKDIKVDMEIIDPIFTNAIKSNPKTAEAIDKYRRSTLTDGQGWRSITSYRKVMGMAGKWTAQMENVYDEIMSLREKYQKRVPKAEDSDYNDYMARLSSIAQKAVVFQPVKPFLFTHEVYAINNTDKMLIPVQHKYAEAVLIPELLPENSQVRDMAYWMDEHVDEKTGNPSPIDLICADTVVKVGGFGATDISNLSQYDAEILKERAKSGNTSTEIANEDRLFYALNKAYVHKLSYDDYRIQTNVPEHINSSQLFGTQIRKLIMSGLKLDKHYDYLKNLRKSPKTINLGGKWKSVNAQNFAGRNVLALYNSLVVANIIDSFSTFSKNISDITKLSELLSQSTLFNSRESMDNLLAYAVTEDERFLVPLFEGGLEHDSAALILSIFKKLVNKQSIKGGSAVQVSALGIKDYALDGGLQAVADPKNKENILYVETEMPFDLSYYNALTRENVDLDYDTYCNLDGTLKVGKYLDENDPEYNKYLSYRDEENRVYKPKIEMEFPDILSIVAYRIPTERAYSMINLKVKRFTRKTNGGTIKVPPQFTVVAGFDFDIDKLYFMRREFRKHTINKEYEESNFSKQDRYDIFTEIYEQYPEIAEALRRTKESSTTEGKEDKRALHSFWEEARIDELFGVTKNELFEAAAKELGIDPETVSSTSSREYLEEYDFDKTPEQNSRASRNNLLLNLIQARLSDYETFEERYTPGGFVNVRKAARKLRELLFGDIEEIASIKSVEDLENRVQDRSVQDPEPNYDPSDPMTIIIYNQQNQVAGKLIGIFANQNVNHAFASLLNKFIVKDANAIQFAGHGPNIDGVGNDLLHPPHRKDGYNEVDLNMAELLAAAVDAVKDPSLNFLNLNTITADCGAVLVRLGYTSEEVGLLFNQPVIKKLCEDCFNNNIHVSQALQNLKDKLQGSVIGDIDISNISTETLITSIIENRKAEENGNSNYIIEHAKEQLAVLLLFEKIQKVASDVSGFVNTTKFTASNSVKSTFGGMYAQQAKVSDYISSFDSSNYSLEIEVIPKNTTIDEIRVPISNRQDLLSMSREEYMDTLRMHPLAYEQCMFDMARKAILLLAPNNNRKKAIYPYGRSIYVGARSAISDLSDYVLDEETINDIHKDFLVFILANQENSLFCGEGIHSSGMFNREYYTSAFIHDFLKDSVKEEFSQYLILHYIFPEEIKDQEGNSKYILKVQDIGGLDPYTKERLKESWADMVATDDEGRFINPKAAKLAIDMYMYNFYTLGYRFGQRSFMHLCPTAVKEIIKVPRRHSIPINTFESTKSESNEVYVFEASNAELESTAMEEYGFEYGVTEGLRGEAYAIPLFDESNSININAFKKLCIYAQSNPDKIFKVQNHLTQEDIDDMISAKVDIPSNIQFTKETVLNSDWSGVNYGVNRSYLEFLYEILDGKLQDVNVMRFAEQFLLNHLDNWRFVLNTNAEYLAGFIKDKVKPFDFKTPKAEITVNVAGQSKEITNAFTRIEEDINSGKKTCTWKPIIKIKDNYYIANSGKVQFNINDSLEMTYKLVTSYGIKGQSLKYTSRSIFEGPAVITTQQPALSTPSPESPKTSGSKSLSVDDLKQQIFVNMTNYITATMRNDDMSAVSMDEAKLMAQGILQKEDIREATQQELTQIIEDIKEQVKQVGLTFLDENGNPEQSC